MDIIRDSTLVFQTLLWKHDGTLFMSDDAYGHRLTASGAKWGPEGRFFDGTNDFIRIPHHANMLYTSQDFTLDIWVKPTSATVSILFTKGAYEASGWCLFWRNNRTFQARTFQAGASQYSYTSAYELNTWHNAIVTRRQSSITFDVNGKSDTAFAGSHTNPVTTTKNAKIGIDDDEVSSPFAGIVGEVRIYSRVLTPSERLNNYLAREERYR